MGGNAEDVHGVSGILYDADVALELLAEQGDSHVGMRGNPFVPFSDSLMGVPLPRCVRRWLSCALRIVLTFARRRRHG